MLATAKVSGRLLSSLFDLVAGWPSAGLRSLLRTHPAELSLEEATAHLSPHMLVDIGVTSPPKTADFVAPTSQPLVPPVAAMHRRGDWGGHALGRQHASQDAEPMPLTWTWPLRV